jgi:tetratricopeptide (TPR) repeat protein
MRVSIPISFAASIILSVLVLAFSSCTTSSAGEGSIASPLFPNNSGDAQIAKALNAIETAPDSAAAHTQLAAAYINSARTTGDFNLNANARDAITKALELNGSDVTARKLKASLHLTFHEFAEGRKIGLELEQEMPNDAFVQGVLTDANAELGNYVEAVKHAQRMIDLKPNSASYARVAHLRSLHGDHKGSVEMYKLAANTADPADKEAQSWCLSQLGKELWKAGRFAEAGQAFDEALKILPNYYLALAGKGRVLVSQGRLDESVPVLEAAQQRSPSMDTVFLLGDVFNKLGNTARAGEQYELGASEEKLGHHYDAHRLALFWADRDTNLDAALEIARADHAKQQDIYASDTLAWCLYKKGMLSEAKTYMDEAMRLKTGDARLLYHAGMIENALGNKSAARKNLAAALKIDPAFDLLQAEAAKRTLDSLN